MKDFSRTVTPPEIVQNRLDNYETIQKSMTDFGSVLTTELSQHDPILKSGQSIEVKTTLPMHGGNLTYKCSLQFDGPTQRGRPKKS